MKKTLLVLAVSLVALGGCKTMSHKEYNKLQDDMQNASATAEANAKQASDLAKKNDALQKDDAAHKKLIASLKQEIAADQAKIEELANRNLMITLQSTVLFAPGEFTLNKNGRRVLDKVVPSLQQQAKQNVIHVIGNSDNHPARSSKNEFIDNWDLSARRAASVVRYFVWAHKLPKAMFRVEGRADINPVTTNDTVEGREMNRRIEILIEKK